MILHKRCVLDGTGSNKKVTGRSGLTLPDFFQSGVVVVVFLSPHLYSVVDLKSYKTIFDGGQKNRRQVGAWLRRLLRSVESTLSVHLGDQTRLAVRIDIYIALWI